MLCMWFKIKFYQHVTQEKMPPPHYLYFEAHYDVSYFCPDLAHHVKPCHHGITWMLSSCKVKKYMIKTHILFPSILWIVCSPDRWLKWNWQAPVPYSTIGSAIVIFNRTIRFVLGHPLMPLSISSVLHCLNVFLLIRGTCSTYGW